MTRRLPPVITAMDLLLTLKTRGWQVVVKSPPSSIMILVAAGYVKAHRSGPGEGNYEVRLTGKGRQFRTGILDNR
jgi:hypothetical protein